MLLIDCPWCGARNQNEFICGGEVHIGRPADPDAVSDEDWAKYLFSLTNARGAQRERWCHTQGCRRWFNAIRHTVTDTFWATYRIGESPPAPPPDWDGERPSGRQR
jgi:heterotetrameric sarcosine oxidase delta subunit